jgi:hypothetical protein
LTADEAATRYFVEQGCYMYEAPKSATSKTGYGKAVKRTAAKCFLSKDGRRFEIHDALTTQGAGFDGEATIYLKLQNPPDNWGEVGFKLKTYEVIKVKDKATSAVSTISSLVDTLEGDQLRPILQCAAPCQECHAADPVVRPSVTEATGVVSVTGYVKGYCTSCW